VKAAGGYQQQNPGPRFIMLVLVKENAGDDC